MDCSVTHISLIKNSIRLSGRRSLASFLCNSTFWFLLITLKICVAEPDSGNGQVCENLESAGIAMATNGSAAGPSSVSSEVEFQVTFSNGSDVRANVQVHIDSDDNVTLNLPEDLQFSDDDLTSVSLRTSAKVKILPDLLFSRFRSDHKLFHSTCACFINLTFCPKGNGILRCDHCDYTIDMQECPSRSDVTEMLLQHLPQHQDHPPCLKFACKKCSPPTVVSMEILTKHLEDVHAGLFTNDVITRTRTTSREKEYICPICSMVCFNNATMEEHIIEYHSVPTEHSSPEVPSPDDVAEGIEVRTPDKIRSSAQGNCSAKSLAASVMLSILPCSSILPCPPCLPLVMLLHAVYWGRGSGQGGLWPQGGSVHGGQGIFESSCHILHYDMVLRPEGTSHKWMVMWQWTPERKVACLETSLDTWVLVPCLLIRYQTLVLGSTSSSGW